jgi:hypothetical protein
VQQPTTHRIDPADLRLALSAHCSRGTPGRFAAMSNSVASPSCANRLRGDRWTLKVQPMLSPLMRGRMLEVVERTRLHHGLPEVRRTWGAGLRAMLAETRGAVMLKPTTGAAQ